jgi:hypothetical protein
MSKQLMYYFATCSIALLALMTSPLTHADEYVRTNRATEARETPDIKSKAVMTIPANVHINVIERTPQWASIEMAGKQGWVPSSHIQPMATESTVVKNGFLSWFSAVLQRGGQRFSTGKSASTHATATAGIRGLGEDGAPAARFHSEALQTLKLYAISHSDGDDFANSVGLTSTHLAYLEP